MRPKLQCAIVVATVDHERTLLLRRAIGDLIHAQRKEGKESMSQEELAYRSGISYEYLNRIENYKVSVSVEVLDRIARALGYNRVSEFLSLDETRFL